MFEKKTYPQLIVGLFFKNKIRDSSNRDVSSWLENSLPVSERNGNENQRSKNTYSLCIWN